MEWKNGDKKWTRFELDSTATNKLKLTTGGDIRDEYNLSYRKGEGSDFFLDGTVGSDKISIRLIHTENFREKFLLTNRGFHWINERPFNR